MQLSGYNYVKKRVRTFHSKTTDACRTCKIRRIKCDKEKPACRRCTSTGRTCDGYSPVQPCITTCQGSSSPGTKPCSSSTLSPAVTVSIFDDEQEHRSFDFFCQFTVRQLAGAFDSDKFWQRLLLQATHHEYAVRHAAVALGALHERFETSFEANISPKLNESKTLDMFALQQYSKAIKALLGPQELQGKQAAHQADVVLMTCVLFIYFEILRGNPKAAISHINGGIKILSELHAYLDSPSTTPSAIPISMSPYVPTSTLNMLFIRFDSQASAIIAGRHIRLSSPTLDDPSSGYQPSIPRTFTSLEEARNALDHIRAHGFRIMDSGSFNKTDPAQVSLMLELVRSTSVIRLKQWSCAFEEFIRVKETKENGREGRLFEEAVNILKIQKVLMDCNFGVDQVRAMTDECVWDGYMAEFEEIVKLAEAIVILQGEDTDRVGNYEERGFARRVLCLDAGIALPLYFVAAKCRDRRVRWRAIEIMKKTERQEGLSNTVLTSKVAEHLVRIEEDGLVRDREGVVPRENRVKGVEVILDVEERKACLRYKRKRPGDMSPYATEFIEEWLEW